MDLILALDKGRQVSLGSLHVVSGVEAHAPILPPLAPALLILILELLKFVPCNMITF